MKLDDFLVTRTTRSPLLDPQTYEKIAVIIVDHAGRILDGGNVRQIEDVIVHELLRKGYVLTSRSDLESIIAELRLQTSMITEGDAARIGHVVNAKAVLLVSVGVYQATVSYSARLLDVERAHILWVSSYTKSYGLISRRLSMTSDLLLFADRVARQLPKRTP